MKVVTGSRFLGGFVGEHSMAADFVSEKVKIWCNIIQQLSNVAITKPQASLAALTRSLQFEWNHIQWVIPDGGTLFSPLQCAIDSSFIWGGCIREGGSSFFPPHSFWRPGYSQFCEFCYLCIPIF